MIKKEDLKKLAKERLKDAKVLFKLKRYEGAAYLSGYVLEFALKAKVCKTLGWTGYPETKKEFEEYKSFKTHKLGVLLRLSGSESKLKARYVADWSIINKWDPEMRYRSTSYGGKEVLEIINSTEIITKIL